MQCQCGSHVRIRNVSAHLRTKKHIQWYNTLHCNMDGGPILALGPYKSVNLECANCSHISKCYLVAKSCDGCDWIYRRRLNDLPNEMCPDCPRRILKFDHYRFWCPECESNTYVDPDHSDADTCLSEDV